MSAQANEVVIVEHRSPADIESPVTHGEIETLWRLAAGLAKSGFFPDSLRESQAFAKLVFGRDLGVGATQAMTEINIIEGKPEASANLQAAKIKGSGVYDYRVLDHTASKCAIEVGPKPAPMRDERGAWLPWPQAFGISEFTLEDAKTAGLVRKTKNGQPGMWEKYPRNMLFARAISNATAWYCPDVMNGIRVYAEGEIRETQAQTRKETPAGTDSEVVDAEVVAQAESESQPLDDETRMELAEAIDAAGVPLDLILSAVGIDSLDQAREEHKLSISQTIADRLAKGGEQ